MKPTALSFIALSVAPAVLNAQVNGIETPKEWYKEYPPALKAAQKEGKDLLIDFSGSDWCLPCIWLKKRVFATKKFVKLASSSFVLVDIDDLRRGGNPPDKTTRYRALQKAFGIASFPSVVLATPRGEAYAWTTWSEGARNSPEAFWASIKAMQAHGLAFRKGVDLAQKLNGLARAKALVDGMSHLRADILWRFEKRYINQLRAADPSDKTGYLAYLTARNALTKLEERMPEQGEKPTVSLDELSTAISRYHMSGETLQDALSFKALLQVQAKDPAGALESFRQLLAAQSTRGRFDRGQFMPIGPDDLAKMSAEIERGSADPTDKINQLHSLSILFEHDLPSRFVVSCGPYFSPTIDSRLPIGEEFGRLLLKKTANLSGVERAKALCQPLAGTNFYNMGNIQKVIETVVSLVDATTAKTLLPTPYNDWIQQTPPKPN